MKRIEKLRKDIESQIEVQLKKVQTAKKAHDILSVVDWFDQEFFDYAQKICVKIQKREYLSSNKEFDEFYKKDENE